MYFEPAYQGNFFDKPKDEIDPKLKNNEWCLANAKYAYSLYINDKCGIKYSDKDYFNSLRLYGYGMQNNNIYKDIMLGVNEGMPEAERKGYANLCFDIFSPAQKIMSGIKGMFDSLNYELQLQAIDEIAGQEREGLKEKLWFKKEFEAQLKLIEEITGIKMTDEQPIPENREELEIFAQMGGFKLRYEVAMERLMKYTQELSEWKETSYKIWEDLINLNMAAVMDYVDEYEKKSKVKYVDPTEVIIEYSRDDNFKNSRFCGVPLCYTVEELRTTKCNLTEEALGQLMNKYKGAYGNPNDLSKFSTLGNSYNEFRIPVIHFVWKSVNSKYIARRKNQDGNTFEYEEQYKDGKPPKMRTNPNNKVINTDVKVLYECKWIIGTDYIFDAGLVNDQPRPNIKDVELPLHVYKITGKSLTDNAKSIYDDIMLAKLRLQNAIAKAPPKGLAVDMTAIENLTFGNKKMHPLELLKMYRQTGDIFYRSKAVHGQMGYHNSGRPITELMGGIGISLGETIQAIEFSMRNLSQLTGINEALLSSNVGEPGELGLQKMAMMATANVLKPIYNGYLSIMKSAFSNVSYRIQLLIKYDKEEKAYREVIGSTGLEAIREASNKHPIHYGLYITMHPSDELKMEIRNSAMRALQSGKNGRPVLTYSEYLFILARLDAGDSLDYIRAYIASKEAKSLQEDLALQQQNMQIQGQQNQQLSEQQAQQEEALNQAALQTILIKEKAKAETEQNNIKLKADLEMRNKMLEHNASVEGDLMNKITDNHMANNQ